MKTQLYTCFECQMQHDKLRMSWTYDHDNKIGACFVCEAESEMKSVGNAIDEELHLIDVMLAEFPSDYRLQRYRDECARQKLLLLDVLEEHQAIKRERQPCNGGRDANVPRMLEMKAEAKVLRGLATSCWVLARRRHDQLRDIRAKEAGHD